MSAAALAAKEPLISVDTKKKELIGNYKNGGRELAPTGRPILVNTHDFIDEELGKAIPYGIYDVGRDEGWVSVGISADTAQFAAAAIKAWWSHLGRKRYPKRTRNASAASGKPIAKPPAITFTRLPGNRGRSIAPTRPDEAELLPPRITAATIQTLRTGKEPGGSEQP